MRVTYVQGNQQINSLRIMTRCVDEYKNIENIYGHIKVTK